MGPPRTPQKALIHRPVPKVSFLTFGGPTGLIICLSLQYVERIHSKETSSVTVSIHRHPDTSYRRMGPRSLKLTQLARVGFAVHRRNDGTRGWMGQVRG